MLPCGGNFTQLSFRNESIASAEWRTAEKARSKRAKGKRCRQKVPATKSGEAARLPSFGGWHFSLFLEYTPARSADKQRPEAHWRNPSILSPAVTATSTTRQRPPRLLTDRWRHGLEKPLGWCRFSGAGKPDQPPRRLWSRLPPRDGIRGRKSRMSVATREGGLLSG